MTTAATSARVGAVVASALLSGQASPSSLLPGCWEAALSAADAHELAPALWGEGIRRRWWNPIPADVRDAVRAHLVSGVGQPELALLDAYEHNEERMKDLLAQGDALLRALHAVGIPAVPLKGWHTVTNNWWPSPAERTMRDLDVLVAAPDVDATAALLADLGYRTIASGHTDAADHELAPVALPGRLGSVEVHRQPLLSRWQRVLAADTVLAGGTPMSNDLALVHLVAHAQLHDDAYLLGRLPLRAVHEYAMLHRRIAERAVAPLDWDAVIRPFHDGRRLGALAAHAALAHTLFGVPLADELTRHRVARTMGRVAATRAMALLDRPRVARTTEAIVYLPRALGPRRMRYEYATTPYPMALARHARRRTRKTTSWR